MAVTIGGRQWRTLGDDIRANGVKVTEITAGGRRVYPDSAHAIRMHLKASGTSSHMLRYAGTSGVPGGISASIANSLRNGGEIVSRSMNGVYDYAIRMHGTGFTNYLWYEDFYQYYAEYDTHAMWREYNFSSKYGGDIVVTIKSKEPFGLVTASGHKNFTGHRNTGYPFGVWTGTNSSGWLYPNMRVALDQQPLVSEWGSTNYRDFGVGFLFASEHYPLLPYESPLDFDVTGMASCDGVFHEIWGSDKQEDWERWFNSFGSSVNIHVRDVTLANLTGFNGTKLLTNNGTLRIGGLYDAAEIPEMGEGRRYMPLTHVLIAAPPLPGSGYDRGSVKCIFNVSGYELIA